MSINRYFELTGFYLNSLKIINYSKVIIIRYSPYNLLNSRYLYDELTPDKAFGRT
jgi:hypothetical protein